VLAFWALAALAVVIQRIAQLVLDDPGIGRFRQDKWLLGLWALATPAIVWAARRFPVRGSAAVKHAALHLAAGTAFIIAGNVIIRIPLLSAPYSLGIDALARDTLLGLVRFYPAALIVYGVILTLAHRAWAARENTAAPAFVPPVPEPETSRYPERVTVREWSRTHLVRPEDIDWIEADDNYVVVHAGTRTYKGRGRISDLETHLDPTLFVRVHRSAIVRVDMIREVQPLTKGDLALVLHDTKVVRVARSRRAALTEVLGKTLGVPLR
jgi:hypothetical protein